MFRALALRLRPASSEPPVSRWRRVGRFLRRWKKSIAFAGLIVALLVWTAWPHLAAGAAGLQAERRGHYVEWGHSIPEDFRRWAPLPTDAALWKTPVSVMVNAKDADPESPHRTESLADALDLIERMPGLNSVSVMRCPTPVTLENARRLSRIAWDDDSLYFWRCSFEPGSLEILADLDEFQIVELSDGTIPPGELAAFARSPELIWLTFDGVHDAGGQLVAFAEHPSLAVVRANRTSFNDADLVAIASCDQLHSLALDRTAVTDAGFEILPDCVNLTKASFSETAITDATVRRLAERCPNLEELDLSGTRVTDDALPHLARLTALRVLDLTNTRVTVAAADPNRDWAALQSLWLSSALAPPGAPVRGRDELGDGGRLVHYREPPPE